MTGVTAEAEVAVAQGASREEEAVVKETEDCLQSSSCLNVFSGHPPPLVAMGRQGILHSLEHQYSYRLWAKAVMMVMMGQT
jgi:hypothetical protein